MDQKGHDDKETSEVKYDDDFIEEELQPEPQPVYHPDVKEPSTLPEKHKKLQRRFEPEYVAASSPQGFTASSVVRDMTKITSNVNGWNSAASKTISNWYNVFREYGYVYGYVLDTNQKMAGRLNMISTISSSTLGIFSAFKLWMNDEQTFRTASDIILMMFNFGIAILTTASKRYLDDARNEKIRIYIEDIDKFLGEISAQVLKMPEYRMDATEFLNKHNDTYTKLITQQPSLTLEELTEGKKLYKKFITKKPEMAINSTDFSSVSGAQGHIILNIR